MKALLGIALATSAALAIAAFITPAAQSAETRMVPKFEPDPTWPHLPTKWVFGQVSSISIDERAQIRDGWFHSDELHVIERLRRQAGRVGPQAAQDRVGAVRPVAATT